jgi:hypothetical protein
MSTVIRLTGIGGGIFGLGLLLVVLTGLGVSAYGLVLAFKASILLGFLCLFVEPSPLIFGLAMLIGGVNIPQKIVEALGM